MSGLPKCPKCSSAFTYEDGGNLVCPECAHEWSKDAEAESGEQTRVYKDDLKIKGSSSVVKVGTKVKNIRLIDGDHDIDCKIDGIGAMQLKTEFVKKA
jgi:protein PhnA